MQFLLGNIIERVLGLDKGFLSREGDIDSALIRISEPEAKRGGLGADIAGITEIISKYPWTELQKLKGDSKLLETVERAESVLANLRNALKQ